MKKIQGRTTKFIGFMLTVACFVMAGIMQIQAAGTVTVTPDKTSVAVGETVNVAVQTSAPEDPATIPEVSVVYNSDILTFAGCNVEFGGGGGLVTFYGQSAVLTFTAAQTGNVNVAAEAIIDDDGANPATAATVIAVGANAQGGLSSDATLYALEMDPGEMVPAFSSNVTEYKIIIGKDVTDIKVSGAVSDPGAQITAASGFKNLKEGTNQAVITITAADGTMLTYHFTIERGVDAEEAAPEEEAESAQEEEESNQTSDGLNVTIDQISYTIQTTISEDMLPDGCVKTSATFNGQAVEAALFEKGGLTLLYALSADGVSGEYFIYNEGTGKLQFFVQIYSIENRFIIPIEAQDNPPSQFTKDHMQWNNSSIPAFVLADTSVANAEAFYLLYAVSNEGERGFYLYDALEGTYQRFLNYTGAKAVATGAGDGMSKKAIVWIAVLAILLIGAIILIVNMLIKNKELQDETMIGKKARPKRAPAKKPEPKRAPARKPEARKTVTPEPDELDELLQVVEAAQAKPEAKRPTQPKAAEPKPVARTAEELKVDGAVGITGNIPIKVVPTPKAETRRPMVPIYTLERQPVQLTREAPPDQLDDDFEFEFINMDNE